MKMEKDLQNLQSVKEENEKLKSEMDKLKRKL